MEQEMNFSGYSEEIIYKELLTCLCYTSHRIQAALPLVVGGRRKEIYGRETIQNRIRLF